MEKAWQMPKSARWCAWLARVQSWMALDSERVASVEMQVPWISGTRERVVSLSNQEEQFWGRDTSFGLGYAVFWNLQGLLTSRLYTFVSAAPKLRSPSQRLVGRLSAAARVGAWSPRALHLFCLAGELSWSSYCTQASLSTGTTAPNLIFSGIITANNSLLGKSNSCNFSLLLENLEGWVMYYPQNPAHASHIVKLSSNKMVWKSVSFQKGLHSSSYWKWVLQGIKKLYALCGV